MVKAILGLCAHQRVHSRTLIHCIVRTDKLHPLIKISETEKMVCIQIQKNITLEYRSIHYFQNT